MKNFKIGKEIVELLKTDEGVTTYVGNKIFPLIANATTTFPFIVYRRNYYTPDSNKDWENEKCGIEIVVASTKYEESVNIADAVSEALNHKTTEDIEDINITNTNEDFYEDTYVQRINIEVTIK